MHYKTLLSFLFVFITAIHLSAQPTVIKQRAYGGPGSNRFADMQFTYDGGMILAGSSFADKGIDKSQDNRDPSGATNDYWIIKIDSLGRKLWDRTMGGNSYDEARAICATRDHGYLVGGRSTSGVSHEKTQPNRGEYDFWIVKLDSTGQILWDKTIGGSDYEELNSIDTTPDGGFILGGLSLSGISGDKTTNSIGGGDYWVIKLDASGNIIWEKTIGGLEGDVLMKIRHTADGGYIAGGTSNSGIFADKSESSRGGQDYWVVKLDAAGNIEWDKTLGGNDEYENFADVIQTSDGGYVAAGFSASDISGEKTHQSKGGLDYWLVKLSAAGSVEWDKTIGGNNQDYLTNILQTKDKGLLVAGYSYSGISGDKTEPRHGSNTTLYSDTWVIKLKKGGAIEWDKTIGGNKGDNPAAILQYNHNNYIIGNSSNSPISGEKTIPLKGTSDYWLVLLHDTPEAPAFTSNKLLSLQHTVEPVNNFTVFPNPAKNFINIQSKGKAAFILADQTGKVVLSKTINGNGQIHVAHLPVGIYYLQNTTTGARQKVLIE